MAAKQTAKRKSVKGEPRSAKTSGSKAKSSKASSAGKGRKSNAKQPKKRRWLRVAAILLVVAIVAILAAFSWDRWFRFDDAADVQGSWQASGQAAVVVIDGEQMHLTDEVAYEYALDTGAKTIEFSFGKLTGSGTYRFSGDRQTLTIVEGGSSDVVRDFLRFFGLDIGAESEADLPTTVFEKVASGSAAGDDAAAGGDADDDKPADGQAGEGSPDGLPDATGDAADAGDGDEDAGGSASGDAPSEDASGGDAEGGNPAADDGMLFDSLNDRGVSP